MDEIEFKTTNFSCPFCCDKYGSRPTCDSYCRMWVDDDCIIKNAFGEFAKNLKRLNND